MSLRTDVKRLERAVGAADPPWVPVWLDEKATWKTLDGGVVRELNEEEIEAARARVRAGKSIVIREYVDE